MIRGGIADKLGNAYESRWTLLQALTVIIGTADTIQIEPVNHDAGGFEFSIATGSRVDWHQCKRRRRQGAWTLAAMEREGVLSDFARKLHLQDTGCVFVTSDPVNPFKGLAGKAALIGDLTGFEAALAEDEAKALVELRGVWSVDDATAFDWLKRCKVEIISDDLIEKHLRMYCSVLFRDDAALAIDRLEAFLATQLTRTLGTEALRPAVEALGLSWCSRFDPTTEALLAGATENYLASLRAPIANTVVEVPAAAELITSVLSGPEKTVVVAGQAGAGKSFVLSQLVQAARAAAWPVLAFRIDRHLDARSLKALGEGLFDRPDHPVGMLGNFRAGRPSLLVIDQVDAVSEASGRSVMVRELLFQLVRAADLYPGMKVVLACRTYDLDNDSRLTSLASSIRSRAVRLLPVDWEASVVPVLQRLGRFDRPYSEREQRLLCLPLNLHLFAEIARGGGSTIGALSTSTMFERLLDLRAREFREAGIGWTPNEALGVLSVHMSANQELAAPSALLNRFPGAVDALSSAGLVTAVRGQLQFAHESFFDVVYSDHFLTLGLTVRALLLSGVQGLFRRTQCRQIFARLRDRGADARYRRELVEMMEAQDVRYLVKDAIGAWLNALDDPTQKELEIVLRWFTKDHPLEQIGRTALAGAHWLPIVLASGQIEAWLEDEARKSFALGLLRQGAATHASGVAQQLRRWWGSDASRLGELLFWFNHLYPDDEIGVLEPLYVELIQACPAEAFANQFFAYGFDVGSLAHKTPALACRILACWLRRWFEVTPKGHPFERHSSRIDAYWLAEMSKSHPLDLAQAIVPLFQQAIERDAEQAATEEFYYSTLSQPLFGEDDHDDFANLLRTAVRSAARTHPTEIAALLAGLSADTPAGLLPHLNAIAGAGEPFADRLLPLLDNPHLLSCGYRGIEWKPFAEAAGAALPFVSKETRNKIESLVRCHRPEIATAKEHADGALRLRREGKPDPWILHLLAHSGLVERGIWYAIGPVRLSPAGEQRLAELDRKFADQPLPEALSAKGGWVESPIDLERAKRMSNLHWLSAIRRHSGDRRHVYLRDRIIGGAEQLAHMLGTVAKEDPQRFIGLLETIPVSANTAYAEALITAFGGVDLDEEALRRVGAAIQRWPQASFGRELCWLVRKHPALGQDPAILALILAMAEDGQAFDGAITSSQREGPTEIQALIGHGGDLDMRGLNSDRGTGFLALGQILWDSDLHLEAIVQVLDRRIADEPLSAVRMQMPSLINSLSKYDPDGAIERVLALADKDLACLNGGYGAHFLRWASYNHPQRLRPVIDRLCAEADEALQAFGFFLLSGLALTDAGTEADFRALWPTHPVARRVAGFRASGNIGQEGVQTCAEAWVIELIFGEERAARDEASRFSWSLVFDADPPKLDLARAFLASPAFEDHPDRLVMALAERIEFFPDLAIESVQAFIRLLEASSNLETRRARYLAVHRLGQILVNLYRAVEGDAPRESALLDLFDQYLAGELHDTRQAVEAYERD